MQTAAVTSQAALTDSPRVSATTAKEIVPKTATAVHVSFSRNVTVPLPGARLVAAGIPLRRLEDQQLFDQREHFLAGRAGEREDRASAHALFRRRPFLRQPLRLGDLGGRHHS